MKVESVDTLALSFRRFIYLVAFYCKHKRAHTCTRTHTHTHTHTSSQEVRSGKFEMYDYGSAEDNITEW